MNQQTVSSKIINQIIEVTRQLGTEEFMQPLQVLSGNTYGKHVRHIIEFYNCLLNAYSGGIVDYDTREHNPLIENNKSMAIEELNEILNKINSHADKPMILKVNYAGQGTGENNITSFNRELIYNLEHAIHHMAIMKIAIENSFQNIQLPDHFGVAYSTVRFQEKQCAQ